MKQQLVLLFAALQLAWCLQNGLARTPQMGWNSWNRFGCGINEQLIKQTADAFISLKLKDAGYEYVNMDDCWAASRNEKGEVQVDPKDFPSGVAALAQYVHSKGLKFGLYSDAGIKTCAGRPGSLGYEKIDAATYAAWEVDYLKYDNCNDNKTSPESRYPRMRDALLATKRPILFSMCEWGVDNPATWAPEVGNSWRTTGDINDHWNSMVSNLDRNDAGAAFAAPGGWNDPDMLEVGNGGMTTTEYTSHFSLWALVKAPLLIGCDLVKITNATLEILTNKEVIAINQDPSGLQGRKLAATGLSEVWGGPQSNGTYAFILFNRDSKTVNITAHFSAFGLEAKTEYSARDLWTHKDLGTVAGTHTASVESHGVVFIKLTKAKN